MPQVMEADVREAIFFEKPLVFSMQIFAGNQFSQGIRKDQIVLLPTVSDFSL
jgi:hypothetical protein